MQPPAGHGRDGLRRHGQQGKRPGCQLELWIDPKGEAGLGQVPRLSGLMRGTALSSEEGG